MLKLFLNNSGFSIGKTMKEEFFRLQNGILLYLAPNSNLHRFCIGLYWNAGPLYETPKQNGVSHLIEHLLFRQSANYSSQNQIYQAVNRIGGYYNGETLHDYMMLNIVSSSLYFREAADVIFDALHTNQYNENIISAEKAVVKQQIANTAQKNFFEYYTSLYLEKTIYAKPIMGTQEGIEKLTVNEINNIRKTIISPQNTLCCLSGDFSKNDTAKLIKTLESIEGEANFLTPRPNLLPIDFCNRTENSNFFYSLEDKEDDVSDISFIFDLNYDETNAYAVDLLCSILSQGLGSLLNAELREKHAYTDEVYGEVIKKKAFAYMEISFSTNMTNLLPCLDIIFNKIDFIKYTLLTDEWEENKTFFIENQTWLYDNPRELQLEVAWKILSLKTPDFSVKNTIEQYKKITPEILQTTAKDFFKSKNMSIFLSYNKDLIPKKLLTQAIKEGRKNMN